MPASTPFDGRPEKPNPADTAEVPMVVVPVELLRRCLAEVRGDLAMTPGTFPRKRLKSLIADIEAALLTE